MIKRRTDVIFRVQHLQQRFFQIRPQQLIAGIQRLAKDRLSLIQFPSHAHILRTLPGEQEGYLRPFTLRHQVIQHIGGWLPGDESIQPVIHLPGIGGDHGQTCTEMSAPGIGAKGHIWQGDIRMLRQIIAIPCGQLLQRAFVPGGQCQNVGRALCRVLYHDHRLHRCFLDDHMRIRAAKAKRTYPRHPGMFARWPGEIFSRYDHWELRPGNARAAFLKMQMTWYFLMLQRQDHLHQPRDAGSRFQMTDVGFDGANHERLTIRPALPQNGPQRFNLDRIAQGGAGAVRFHITHVRWSDAGIFQRLAYHLLLCGAIRHGQAAAAPILVDR